jgi:GR25 family glycosyltransferase involved in LPS biosynthesis
MKAFVIGIADNEKSLHAAERCMFSGDRVGAKIRMFNAITPKNDPVSMLEKEGIDPARFDEVYSRNLNCMAAFLSHYTLWKQCAEGTDTFAIFEHDAVLDNPIPSVHFRYVMNIGAPSYGKWNTPSLMGVNPLTTKRYFPGAHAYMVTPAGAQLLVENAGLYAKPTDVYMHLDTFPWLQEYYPFVARADDSFTTIQVERGCLAKHNYKDGYEIINV